MGVFFLLIPALAFVGLRSARLLPSRWVQETGDEESARLSRDEIRKQAAERIEPTFAWARRESRRALETQLRLLKVFFDEARERVPEFSESVLGFRGKWYFLADKVPFTKGDRHPEFLRRAFAEHLFAPEDLVQLMEQVSRGYADALESIENRMLVRLREDVEDLPGSALPEFADPTTLRAAYQESIARTLAHFRADLRADLATEVLSLVAGEVLAQVAVRMGVSAGLLAASATTSWATFGVGLAVGLVVDQLVSWVWDWWADPAGQLTTELQSRLQSLHTLIVEGDEASVGLRSRLVDFARQRANLRERAVENLLSRSGTYP